MTQLDRENAIRTKSLMDAKRRLSQETGIPKKEIRIIETGRSAIDTTYKLTYGDGKIAGWVEESCARGTALLLINEEA